MLWWHSIPGVGVCLYSSKVSESVGKGVSVKAVLESLPLHRGKVSEAVAEGVTVEAGEALGRDSPMFKNYS
jgi:hypothetical protein